MSKTKVIELPKLWRPLTHKQHINSAISPAETAIIAITISEIHQYDLTLLYMYVTQHASVGVVGIPSQQ